MHAQVAYNPPRLANPLAGAHVTPERIDQGVDYAGTGYYAAVARGVVTKVLGASSGWPGNYIEMTVTQPGPLFGRSIFYAEGVAPTVRVGQTVNPGDRIANLIPGWPTGTELGFASGVGSSSYASQHGGYTEGHSTAAGIAFSRLIQVLGGPGGTLQAGSVTGTAPSLAPGIPHGAGGKGGGGLASIFDPLGGVASSVAGDINSAANTFAGATGYNQAEAALSGAESAAKTGVDVGKALGKFVDNPVPTLLTIALVALGAFLAFHGTRQMLTGFGSSEEAPA